MITGVIINSNPGRRPESFRGLLAGARLQLAARGGDCPQGDTLAHQDRGGLEQPAADEGDAITIDLDVPEPGGLLEFLVRELTTGQRRDVRHGQGHSCLSRPRGGSCPLEAEESGQVVNPAPRPKAAHRSRRACGHGRAAVAGYMAAQPGRDDAD